MASVLLSKLDVGYLEKCSGDSGINYGIIIGQNIKPESFLVVHLAKNCEEDMEILLKGNENELSQGPTCIAEISSQALATQWISASKMCPGSFNVQGVFVTSEKQNLDDENTYLAAKKMLHNLQTILIQSNVFCASIDEDNLTLIFLAYSAANKKAICQGYTHDIMGGSFATMNCHFIDKPMGWHTFECCYELDEIFPIFDDSQRINIENQFQRALLAMKRSLSESEMFIENIWVDESLPLDGFVASNRKKVVNEHYKATIFLPVKCHQYNEHSVKVRKFNGTIRLSGIIFSKIWCSNRNTLGDVKRFVQTDILRSLAARIQVYCDGLTDPHVTNDSVFISEPPRRVFFNLFADGTVNPIQFSEYIFRGEAPTVAVAQAKQVLDLDISLENIIADLEGLPDDEIFSDVSLSNLQKNSAQPIVNTAKYLTRSMYILSITISLLVLLCSIWLHYFFA
ncbi:protein odr-4 homolog isoform X3 [Zeugodacus cucurbitae]|uniref:Protein odr-4 homolog n=1 Tax=Zeugodacus cucurbitae TaxID=28588 RepID=A0A0A1XDR8_ZEUCU|nr:protein odr-4 homolog isoform X3 [Zeugodacus cucurbitae]